MNSRHHARWTEEELDILLDLLGRVAPEKIARQLGRSQLSILLKARRIGVNQYTNQGLVTANKLIQALGFHSQELATLCRWGLKSVRGPMSGGGRCRMYDLEDVYQLLSERPELARPELARPRRCRELGIDIRRLQSHFRWKRVECERTHLHATAARVRFWAPLYEPHPTCSSCGRFVSQIAVGAFQERYRIDPPPVADIADRISARHLQILLYLRDRWAFPKEIGQAIGFSRAHTHALVHDLVLSDLLARICFDPSRCRLPFYLTPAGMGLVSALAPRQEVA